MALAASTMMRTIPSLCPRAADQAARTAAPSGVGEDWRMQVSQRANVAARQIVREQQQHVVGARASRRHSADATLAEIDVGCRARERGE